MFKRLLSDWFGPKYKSKVSSYMDNARTLLRSRLNLGFNLNYFRVFIVHFVHLEFLIVFRDLFYKMYIFEVVTFFSRLVIIQ